MPHFRAANIFSFTRERYNNVKYRNSPYYKGALLWDTMSDTLRRSTNMLEFKKGLLKQYKTYTGIIT